MKKQILKQLIKEVIQDENKIPALEGNGYLKTPIYMGYYFNSELDWNATIKDNNVQIVFDNHPTQIKMLRKFIEYLKERNIQYKAKKEINRPGDWDITLTVPKNTFKWISPDEVEKYES